MKLAQSFHANDHAFRLTYITVEFSFEFVWTLVIWRETVWSVARVRGPGCAAVGKTKRKVKGVNLTLYADSA